MTVRSVATLATSLCSLLVATTAAAQNARSGDVAANRFQPALGPENLVTVERARVPDSFSYSLGLMVDYARDPLRLRHCAPDACGSPGSTEQQVHVVKDLATANLMASIVPVPRLQIGLRVPLQYVSGQGVNTDPNTAGFGGPAAGGISGFAMGDPALEAKFRAIGGLHDPVNLAIAGSVSAPLGHATADGDFAGYGSPVADLRAILDVDRGRFFAGANAGAGLKSTATLGSLHAGSEARAGLGLGYRITPVVHVLADAFGSTTFVSKNGAAAAEVDGAVRILPKDTRAVVTAGVGGGLNEGVGAPLFRVFAGVGYFVDKGGERPAAEDLDLDKDGITNDEDECPREGGDVVRLPGPFYGCPKRDSDDDKIPDHLDACYDKPGVATQDPKTNGCPPNDRDNDGIPNDQDKCPDAPETYNGFQDEDGCPDAPPISVEIRNDQIVIINERVNFEFNSDKIQGARSFEALDAVAKLMKEHKEVELVEVAGHTDNVGDATFNMDLSKRRAAAVAAYLASKGVDAKRLTSNGYGQTKPIAKNDSDAGRAANRRVQFNILK